MGTVFSWLSLNSRQKAFPSFLSPLQKNSFSLEPMHTSCAVSMRSVMKKKKKKVIYVLILIKVISEVPNQKAVEGDQSFYPILFV